MNFRILGDVAAEDNGRPINLGGPRQRLLLAILLVEPNRALTASALIDAIWDGEELPRRPERALQTYVSRLRRSLGADRVVTRPNGFLLSIDPDQLDAHRYEVAVRAARTARGLGDLERAAENYRHTTTLWTGPPWDDYADRYWASSAANRLTELHKAAAWEYADCLLALGRPAQALETVEPLLAQAPLQDDLRRIEMLALYRLGRAVDAIRSYQRHRHRVLEETGLEPAAELAELEARMVRRDPKLDRGGPSIRGYRLLSRVRQQDDGVIWRARQPGLDREVMVEVLDVDLANDPEFIRHFDSQVRAFSRLEHPSICSLLDAWRDHQGAFVVIPLVHSIADSPPVDGWTASVVRRLVADIAGALAFLHRQGLEAEVVDATTVGFSTHGDAVLLGFPPFSRGTDRPGDVESLARLGLDLLRQSSDVDTGLVEVLTTVADGDRPDADAGELLALLHRLSDRGSTIRAEARSERSEARNPYKGLRPFDLADAGDFFGRKELIDELVDRTLSSRLLSIVGPSGSGKSSLVRAGLLPALMRRAELGGRPWFSVTMVPGPDPYEALEAALLRIAVNPPSSLRQQLTDGNRGIVRAVERTLPDDRSDLLLLIDQFEELWTVTASDVREPFLAALAEAVDNGSESSGNRLRVVATVRADLYDRPLSDPSIGELLARSSVPLSALTAEQLEQVVVGPAGRVGIEFEPSVVAEIVRIGTSSAASLPLIQFALAELFEVRAGDVIGKADLQRLGGIEGSIGRRAEETFRTLDARTQAATRTLFGRLVNLTTEETTRRRALKTEFTDDAILQAANAFIEARLLTVDRDHHSRAPTIEVTHEALLGSWHRLRDWINEDADELRMIGRLVASSRRWHESGEDAGELLRGAALAAAASAATDHPERFTDEERSFIDASERLLADQQFRERQRVRRLRAALSGVAVLLAVSMVSGLLAVRQRDRARQAAFDAESFRLAAVADDLTQADPAVGLLMAAEAYRRTPGPETLGGLQQAMISTGPFLGHVANGVQVEAVHWLDDHRLVLVSPGRISVVAAGSGDLLIDLPFDYPTDRQEADVLNLALPTALHPGTGRLAVAGTGSTVEIIDLDSRTDRRSVVPLTAAASALAFAPDGTSLFVGDEAGVVTEVTLPKLEVANTWETASGPRWVKPAGYRLEPNGSRLFTGLAGAGVLGLAVSDDNVVATGGARINVWDRRTGGQTMSAWAHLPPETDGAEPLLLAPVWPAVVPGDPDRIIVVEGGKRIGSISLTDGTQRWNEVGDLIRDLLVLLIIDVSFDANRVFVLVHDGAIRVADVDTGAFVGDPIPLPHGEFTSMEISPDRRMAAVSTRRGVSLFAIDGSGILADSIPLSDLTEAVTISPGGDMVATTGFQENATHVFDRTAEGYVERALPAVEVPNYIELNGIHEVGVDVGMEWRVDGDGLTESRQIDRTSLEPVTDWVPDTYAPVIDPARNLLYSAPLAENFVLPDGVSRVRIYKWPERGTTSQLINMDLAAKLPRAAVLVDGGRVLLGTTEAHELWALDLETRSLIEPPFSADGGVKWLRYGPDQRFLYVGRVDGSFEQRDGETFELVHTFVGTEVPAANSNFTLAVDEKRSQWLTATNNIPRLVDIASGLQLGTAFPHDDPRIELVPADGTDGVEIQLITANGGYGNVWNLDTATWYDLACQAAGRNLTVAEWKQFGPRDRDPEATCPQWPDPSAD